MSGALSFTPIAVPDFGQTLARAQGMQANRLAMLAQQRQMDNEDALRGFLATNAGDLASPDAARRQNVLAQLAAQGPQGLQIALPVLQRERESQQLQGALGALGLGGVSASPGVPAPAPAPGGSSAAMPPAELMPFFAEASRETGIPIPLLVAQARQESNFNPNARGRAGEIGIMQIHPNTARNPGFGLAPMDLASLNDPRTNILNGARYLAARAGQGDWNDQRFRAQALGRYNGGGDPNYVANVLRFMPGAEGGARTIPVADGGSAPAMDPAAAQRAGGQITSDQFLRFIAGVAGNPQGMAVAQAIAPFVRQGEQTEIREMGAQGNNPAGLYLLNRQNGQPIRYIGPAAQGQGTQTDRDQARYMELDANRANLTPAQQQELALIERRLTMPQTIVAPDGSIRTIQPPPLPRRDQQAGTIPVSAPGAAPAGGPADAQPVNAPRQQTTTTPGGQTVTTVQEPRLQPDTAMRGMLENANNLRQAQQALELITARPQSVGLVPGALHMSPVDILNRHDPDGTRARAAIAAIGATRVHDLSGAAVTISEYPRLRPFIPQIGDSPETVRAKLVRFVEEYQNILRDQYRSYGPENQFRAVPQVEELLAPQSAGPGGQGSAEPPPPQGQRPPLSSFNRR